MPPTYRESAPLTLAARRNAPTSLSVRLKGNCAPPNAPAWSLLVNAAAGTVSLTVSPSTDVRRMAVGSLACRMRVQCDKPSTACGHWLEAMEALRVLIVLHGANQRASQQAKLPTQCLQGEQLPGVWVTRHGCEKLFHAVHKGALEDAAPGQEVVVRAALHGLPSLGTHDGHRPYRYPAARINRAFTLCLPVVNAPSTMCVRGLIMIMIMIIIMTSMCKEASMDCSGTRYAPSAGCQWGTSTCSYLGPCSPLGPHRVLAIWSLRYQGLLPWKE